MKIRPSKTGERPRMVRPLSLALAFASLTGVSGAVLAGQQRSYVLANIDIAAGDDRMGNPAGALQHWPMSDVREPVHDAADQALRVAAGRKQDSIWLDLAARITKQRALMPHEFEALRQILARPKAPVRANAFLRSYARRFPQQREPGMLLAQAASKPHPANAVVPPLLHAPAPVADPVELARREAALLVESKKIDEASQTLEAVLPHAKPGDASYWLAYGNLAWLRGARPDALLAYRTAWDAGAADGVAAERLIELYNDRGEPNKAIAIGNEAAERVGGVRWRLLAMDAAARASQWGALRELQTLAKRDEFAYADSVMYWLLVAHVAAHDGQKAAARSAYARALAIDPASAAARVQLLWFEIGSGEREALERRLLQWQPDAEGQTNYWRAYASGFLRLKRVDEAIVWFEKVARAEPNDFVWMADFADALEQAGQKIDAQRIRKALLTGLRASLSKSGGTRPADTKLLMVHARLVHEIEGPAAGEQAFSEVLAAGYDGADVYSALVGSTLAQKNYRGARDWLQRATAANRQVPAYLTLAVGLAQNDRPAITELLAQREQELSAADRITAMRRVGRNKLALTLAEKSLAEENAEGSELLRQHRDQLKLQLARSFEAKHERSNISDLELSRTELSFGVPLETARLTARVAHIGLTADSNILGAPVNSSEVDISLLTELSAGDVPLRVTVGRNQRRDASLTYGRLESTHTLGNRVTARLDLSVNRLTEETAPLRLIGSKDKLAAIFRYDPTDQIYAWASLAGQRFRTRGGETLGHGALAEAEIGKTIAGKLLTTTLRLSGSILANQVRDSVPASWPDAPQLLMENFLPRRFSTAGVGASLQYGSPRGTRPFAALDVWAGRQYPVDSSAYSARLAAGVPVSSASHVRLDAFYSNVQGIFSSRPNRGIGIWYSHLY